MPAKVEKATQDAKSRMVEFLEGAEDGLGKSEHASLGYEVARQISAVRFTAALYSRASEWGFTVSANARDIEVDKMTFQILTDEDEETLAFAKCLATFRLWQNPDGYLSWITEPSEIDIS